MDLKKSVSAEDELKKLRCELEEEKQRKSRVDKTIDQLERKIDNLAKLFEEDVTDEECQKWRTKYEMQADFNWKLDDEIKTLSQRVVEANQLLAEKNRLKRKFEAADQTQKEPDTIRSFELRQLEREKLILQGELRNAEHRLDRESQAFHKADEACRRIDKDIGPHTKYQPLQANHHQHNQQQQQKQQQQQMMIHRHGMKKQTASGSSSLTSSSSSSSSGFTGLNNNKPTLTSKAKLK